MKISIITPSFNQGIFIEDTILSILDQNHPDFEHIIIDGGSTDSTIEILKKYPHLKWISEKDNGQSNAINKGLKLATGDIIAWINSDDYYEKHIFRKVSEFFLANKECKFLYGDITYIDRKKNILYKLTGNNINFKNLLKRPDIVRQPSSFWRKEIIDEIGFLDENLHLVMDFDFFLRISKRYKLCYINENLSYYRCYDETKTLSLRKKQTSELYRVIKRNVRVIDPFMYKYLLGKYLDSLDDSSALKKILNPLRRQG